MLPKKDEPEPPVENSSNDNAFYEIVKKPGIKISYEDTLNPAIFPWNKIIVEGLTTKEIYALYKRSIPSSYIFSKIILNKTIKKGQEILVNIINDKDKTQRIERACPDNNLYCYCRKQYTEEFMVGCSRGDEECVVGGWIHPYCDERLKNLTQDSIQDLDFTCLECLKKYQNPTLDNQGFNDKGNSGDGIQLNKESDQKDILIQDEKEVKDEIIKYEYLKEENNVLSFKINEISSPSISVPKLESINKTKEDNLLPLEDNS
jgi:hypothetical protein